jgi:uncharacterized membrane protein
MRSDVALAIAGMAIVTYLTRAGGFWLMTYLPTSPRLTTLLRALPGSLLVALVAPALTKEGPAGIAAAGAATLVAFRTKNTLAAMLAGLTTIVVLRMIGERIG